MRPDRLVRYGGIGLVLLFPLVSLLQLRDTERPWREAARRARPAVVGLYRTDQDFAACGVVTQDGPPRLVVPGRVGGPLRSRQGDGWQEWRPLCTDVQGEFTLLEAGPRSGGAGLTEDRALSPARLRIDPEGAPMDDVEVALVPPAELGDHPLWVGVLRARPTAGGRPGYVSSYLEPISSVSYTSEALAATPDAIDPMLRGAPFVDQEGTVVAIYLGRDADGIRALPVEVVIQTLALMQLQATK